MSVKKGKTPLCTIYTINTIYSHSKFVFINCESHLVKNVIYNWRKRHRQREIRDMETAEQREERLKIMRERQIERIAMETAEQSDLFAKAFNIRVFPTCLY